MRIPVISVMAAKSNTGKTTLIEKLIPELAKLGIRTAVIKSDVHGFEMDKEGKDTWRFTQAGAKAVAIISERQFSLIQQTEEHRGMDNIIAMISDVDLIITECRRRGRYPKIEVVREGMGTEITAPLNELVAIATDVDDLEVNVPRFNINDAYGIACFIKQQFIDKENIEEELTHFDNEGRARMVDVTEKAETDRIATARGEIWMKKETLALVKAGKLNKGDVLGVAQVAGIMGVKETSRLIPMCHPLNVGGVNLNFALDEVNSKIDIEATVKLKGQTGIEMEALTGVSVAALTIYDMCKAVDKTMSIKNIRLASKKGGKSGDLILE